MQIQMAVPVRSLLAVNGMDGRKNNKGKVGRRSVVIASSYKVEGVDNYVPGVPFTIAKSLRGLVPVKARKVPGVCVFVSCSNKCPKKGKWCATHFEVVRAISLKVNHDRYKRRHNRQRKSAV